MTVTHCAECGHPHRQATEHGAALRCCGGHGYWLRDDPTPGDRIFAGGIPRHKGWWLYLGPTWPRGLRPRAPRVAA